MFQKRRFEAKNDIQKNSIQLMNSLSKFSPQISTELAKRFTEEMSGHPDFKEMGTDVLAAVLAFHHNINNSTDINTIISYVSQNQNVAFFLRHILPEKEFFIDNNYVQLTQMGQNLKADFIRYLNKIITYRL